METLPPLPEVALANYRSFQQSKTNRAALQRLSFAEPNFLRGGNLKKTYETAEIELMYLKNYDIITISGGEDDDTPVIGGDVNNELPFVPRR